MRDPEASPRRWLEPGSELSPELRGVLSRAAAAYDVTPERVAAMERRLHERLGHPGDGGSGGDGDGDGGSLAGGGSGLGRWKLPALGLIALAAVGAAIVLLLPDTPPRLEQQPPQPPQPPQLLERQAPPTVRPRVRRSSPAAAPAVLHPVPAPTVAVAPTPRHRAPRPAPRRQGSSSTLAQEVRLIAAAQRALRADAPRALRLTEQHRARFPGGVLRQEREALAIEALIRLDRRPAARRRAAALYRAAPGTSYRLRIDALFAPP